MESRNASNSKEQKDLSLSIVQELLDRRLEQSNLTVYDNGDLIVSESVSISPEVGQRLVNILSICVEKENSTEDDSSTLYPILEDLTETLHAKTTCGEPAIVLESDNIDLQMWKSKLRETSVLTCQHLQLFWKPL